MEEKRYFEVTVTELMQRNVIVEARSPEEAHQRASDAWSNGEIVLTGKDFEGAEFHVIGETTALSGYEIIESKEG